MEVLFYSDYIKMNEDAFRKLTFWEFLFHQNPDGTLQVGRNPLWAFLAAVAIGGLLIYGVAKYGGQGGWVAVMILPLILTAYLYFTYRQYIGRSK